MNYQQLHSPAARTTDFHVLRPTMDTLCTCGMRYGQHRVNDLRCPNQEWKPGNGQPQWRAQAWSRA